MKQEANLTGIPETMLWTLHNRASEAMREDGCIHDLHCLDIYNALDYDYERHFGKADGSHGVRSMLFDQYLRDFLIKHPDGVIVNLGEGLETQRYRIDAPQALWFSIDLPEAIDIRERFIKPDKQHIHIRKSALDISWFDDIPAYRPVFITAQGLFMYFSEAQMAAFIHALAQRFPGTRLMFDYLNTFLSKRTMSDKGWMKTPLYRTPPMPWGINRRDLAPTLSRWIGQDVTVHNVTFLYPRGLKRWFVPWAEKYLSVLINKAPGVCYIDFPDQTS